MTAPSMRDRLLAALALEPMTQAQLARCLSCSYSYIAHRIQELHEDRRVRIAGRVKCGKMGRPQWLWSLVETTPFASSQGRIANEGRLGVVKSMTCIHPHPEA